MERESEENNKNSSKSDGTHLPLDLTIEILSKLRGKSLARFQCVSKPWSSLISESIMTWSLTKPSLLVICDQEFSVFTLSGQLLDTYKESVLPKQDPHPEQLDSEKSYHYNRGLICFLLRWGQFAIFNPTTRQTLLLPEIEPVTPLGFMEGFFGYDPIENQYKVLCMIRGTPMNSFQVFTLGDPKKKWRNIQGFKKGFYTKSNKVCINGKLYVKAFLGIPSSSVNLPMAILLSFDVRSETFDHALLPTHYLVKITLVNYLGKIGCIYHNYLSAAAKMWVMDHTEKQEWSKIGFFISSPLLKQLGDGSTRIAGVTLSGEVVMMREGLDYAEYYDPKQKKTRRVELEYPSNKELIFSIPDHVENTMSLC